MYRRCHVYIAKRSHINVVSVNFHDVMIFIYNFADFREEDLLLCLHDGKEVLWLALASWGRSGSARVMITTLCLLASADCHIA